jgi:hypothetical protein|tara:strand:- start:318 stop:506 length:189 start_codon:yes stop_codon:yes gene_type:complete
MTEENEIIEEEKDVEVMEFELGEEEIDELITKLQLLKETKEQINFDIDDENSFIVHYEKEEN